MAKLKCINNDCKELNKKIEYLRILSKIKDGKHIYMDKQHNQLVCIECGEPLEFIQPKTDGFPQINIKPFNSLTSNEKKEVLKKRERAHYKTDKQAHEFKKYKDDGGE